MSPGCKCCGPACSWAITVTGCNGGVVSGASVSVTRNPVTAVSVTNGGNGYNNGTFTNGSFSGGGGSGGTFTYTVVGGHVQDTIVITNGGTYTSAPTPVVNPGGIGASGFAGTATLGGETTIDSGTTNASGVFTASLPATGTYVATAAKSLYTTGLVRTTISCPTGGASTIALVADTTHVCCPQCADPLPKTLTLTDSDGTHTLTYSTGSNPPSWAVDTTHAVSNLCIDVGGVCNLVSGNLNVHQGVTCAGSPTGWFYAQSWLSSSCSGTAAYRNTSGGGSICNFSGGTAVCTVQLGVGNCKPVNLSITPGSHATSGDTSSLTPIVGTFTVTE